MDVLGSDGLVEISFTASDEGAAGLAYASFGYETPTGMTYLWAGSEHLGRSGSGTFSASDPVGVWAASGTYRLMRAEVTDAEGNRALYERGSSAFDFTSMDFEVDNPLQDVTAPSLAGARLFEKRPLQGTPVVALYEASDDLSGVDQVHVLYRSPTDLRVALLSLPGLGAVGPSTWLSPLSTPAGTYEFEALFVFDRAGNSTAYSVDGTTTTIPSRAQPAGKPAPDLSDLDFEIVGTVGDRTPPRLTGITSIFPRERALGDQIGFDHSAMDQGGSGLSGVRALWEDGRGHTITAQLFCGDVSRGPVVTEIEDYRTVGSTWRLMSVTVEDGLGNFANYQRDGSVTYPGDPGPITHDLDLSQADFELKDQPPSGNNYARTGWCPRIADVTLELDGVAAVGEIVEALGDVSVAGMGVPDPIVALHQYVNGVPRVATVVKGTAAGDYSAELTARRNSEVVTTFLGWSGIKGADMASSQPVPMVVTGEDQPDSGGEGSGDDVDQPSAYIPVTINVQFERYLYKVGDRARLFVSARPFEMGSPVKLQRKLVSGWKTLRVKEMPHHGDVRFVWDLKKSGRFRYRVVVPAVGSLMKGVSPTLKLRVFRP